MRGSLGARSAGLGGCLLLGDTLGRGLLRGGLAGGLLGRGLPGGQRAALQLSLALSRVCRNERAVEKTNPLGGFLNSRVALGQFLGAGHIVLEALACAEARYRGLLDPNSLSRLGVAGVARRPVDLLERTEAGHRHAVSLDSRTQDGVEYGVHRIGSLLTTSQLVGDGFHQLCLIHEQFTPRVAPDVRTDQTI